MAPREGSAVEGRRERWEEGFVVVVLGSVEDGVEVEVVVGGSLEVMGDGGVRAEGVGLEIGLVGVEEGKGRRTFVVA